MQIEKLAELTLSKVAVKNYLKLGKITAMSTLIHNGHNRPDSVLFGLRVRVTPVVVVMGEAGNSALLWPPL